MNPVNIMFIYFFATKTAENYNLSNPDELKNKALLTSMFSSNLGLSALLTDYLAKNMEKNIEVAVSSRVEIAPAEVIQQEPEAEVAQSELTAIDAGTQNLVKPERAKKNRSIQQQSQQQSDDKETAY